jgi:hypothetical protein
MYQNWMMDDWDDASDVWAFLFLLEALSPTLRWRRGVFYFVSRYLYTEYRYYLSGRIPHFL